MIAFNTFKQWEEKCLSKASTKAKGQKVYKSHNKMMIVRTLNQEKTIINEL